MVYIDRARCAALLEEAGIDALLVVQPENFRYVTGRPAGFLSSWRRAGAQVALVPADSDQPVAVVVADALEGAFGHLGEGNVRSHPVWIDFHRVEGDAADAPALESIVGARGSRPSRPSTYDLGEALRQLRELLKARGLKGARLGIELDFIPASDFAAFKAALPGAQFADSSSILKRLQLVKSAAEISLLQTASEITEAGMVHTAKSAKSGLSARDLSLIFQRAVLDEVGRRNVADFDSSWTAFCCGPNASSTGNSIDPLRPGDAVKLDCGCSVGGYISDVARTYFLGQASRAQREVYKIVLDAWEAGFRQFVPGNPISKIYSTVQETIGRSGFTGFRRGHYGHSIGASVWNEEWPYICEDEHTILEEGMVFAYEVPTYIDGIGSLTIEDHIVVSKDGAYSMNKLGRDLQEI